VALEAIEQRVKAEGDGARLQTNEGLFHLFGARE